MVVDETNGCAERGFIPLVLEAWAAYPVLLGSPRIGVIDALAVFMPLPEEFSFSSLYVRYGHLFSQTS